MEMQSRVKKIHCAHLELQEAYAPQSISIELEDDIDISRGDMVVKTTNQPQNSQEIDAMICWMGENPMQLNGKYLGHNRDHAISRCGVRMEVRGGEVNSGMQLNG